MRSARRRTLSLLLALLLAPPGTVRAQEFTRQTLLVAPLHPDGSSRVARQVAGGLRTRIARLSARRELFVVGTDTVESLLHNSGFRADTVLNEIQTLVLARQMRADEVVVGRVVSRPGVVEVHAQLRIMRDWRLRQPLPVVRAASAGAAADTLARYVVEARSQMVGLRRCENFAREGKLRDAAGAAEAAIAQYPASTLARNCLAIVLPFNEAPADSIRKVTEALLARDTLNVVAAVMHAQSLMALQRQDDAANAWTRVIALRPDSLTLGLNAVEYLLRLQHPTRALQAAATLIARHPDEPRFRRLAFRAHVALGAWPAVAALGDSLDAQDPEFREDSTYAIRHVQALRVIGDTLSALAKSARVVKQHSGDVGLYLQYLQLVTGENAAALARGLAYFPGSSELHVLAARAAVTAGRRRDAINSLSAAVSTDPFLLQGFLQIAELWFEEEQPDSALAAIARAPRNGATDLLRAYTIARGRQMIRQAADTTPRSWTRAVTLFALADTLESQSDSRALLVAASLQLARSELVIATQVKTCPEAGRASSALELSLATLDRGVGEGTSATELYEAYGALRTAVDNAVRILCPAPPPNDSGPPPRVSGRPR